MMRRFKRRITNYSKLGLRKLFEHGQRLGLDILPRHFYSEIPGMKELRELTEWKLPYSMIGVAGTDPASQLRFVSECCPPGVIDVLRSAGIHRQACELNGEEGFGPIEADFLFAVVATRKPAKIFQIGCGVSTAVCILAAKHAAYSPQIICVEPYPTTYLDAEAQRGTLQLVREKAQTIDLGRISDLGSDVLFFVDSSHTLGPAGEVSRIILEMLPRLKPGALVHFHDIQFPYDYPRAILDSSLFFPHESVLLHAFLVGNSRFRILASLSLLHYSAPRDLAAFLPNYAPAKNDHGLSASPGHFPSSTFLEVTG